MKDRPRVKGRMIDMCGTGGDAVKTPNVSTMSSFVAAGAGAIVAKHGGRSVTSKCGSADVLEKLGFNLAMEPSRVKDSIEQIGIGFMFAPVIPSRDEAGRPREEGARGEDGLQPDGAADQPRPRRRAAPRPLHADARPPGRRRPREARAPGGDGRPRPRGGRRDLRDREDARLAPQGRAG